jgi:SHS2 domain-containing protein
MHRWVEHTSELEVHIEAPTQEGVFAEATVALGELLAGEDGDGGERLRREVVVDARDRAALMAAWLEELVFLAESQGLVPEGVEQLVVADSQVRGTVRGRRGAPPHLVKAVTYHGLTFERHGDAWRATAVLDV